MYKSIFHMKRVAVYFSLAGRYKDIWVVCYEKPLYRVY